MRLSDTPVERHIIDGKSILVKREDLSCPPPGPCFSKMRGLFMHMLKLQRSGVTTVGYVETAISMAGWGVAWIARELGMKSVIFDPQYSGKHPARKVHESHRVKWNELEAIVIPMKPLMAKVNFNIARKMLCNADETVLPLGLPLSETVVETAKQVQYTDLSDVKTIVVCVGSGTICSGILAGLKSNKSISIIGVVSRRCKSMNKYKSIKQKAGLLDGRLLDTIGFELINTNLGYIDKVDIDTPFPCNPYYDTKALKFALDNYNKLDKPILFWNIGGGGK